MNIEQVALAFGAMTKAREQVANVLINLCADEAEATRVLKLSAKQTGDLAINRAILSAPTMPAIERYTGTLYDAIHGRGLKGSPTEFNQLDKAELNRAKEIVLIQSALFGLIPATSLIPNYRLSASTVMPDLNLKKHWAEAHASVWGRLEGPIIDLRSKAYADLAPLPVGKEFFTLDVFQELPSGERIRLNHFNKKAKGQLIRAVLQSTEQPKTIADLKKSAQAAKLKLELTGNHIELITKEQVLSK